MVAHEDLKARRRGLAIAMGMTLAAIVMFYTAASLAALALAGTGGPIRIGADTVASLALAIVLALAGIEMIRGRHFLFALLVPAALALLNLASAISAGRAEAFGSVGMMLVVVLLVAGSRQAFRD